MIMNVFAKTKNAIGPVEGVKTKMNKRMVDFHPLTFL